MTEVPIKNDLPMEAIHLASELADGHYGMHEATAMIRRLALALDEANRTTAKATTPNAGEMG